MTLREPQGDALRAPQGDTGLDARYGRVTRRRGAVPVVIAAVVLVAAALAWFIWANPLSTQEFWKSTGYRINDDGSIRISWQITLTEGQRADCAVAAENQAEAIVGWKVVSVAATENPTQSMSETIRTTERADTGLAYRCWLV